MSNSSSRSRAAKANKKEAFSEEKIPSLESLGKRFAAKDNEAMWIFFQCYLDRLIFYIYKILLSNNFGTMLDAEELASDTLLHVWGSYDPDRGKFTSWLYKIARQQAYNFWKKEKEKYAGEIDENVESRADPLDLSYERKELLSEVLKEIPSERKHLLSLKLIEDKTFKEIAEITNETESTVKSQYCRALEAIKTEIKLRELLTHS